MREVAPSDTFSIEVRIPRWVASRFVDSCGGRYPPTAGLRGVALALPSRRSCSDAPGVGMGADAAFAAVKFTDAGHVLGRELEVEYIDVLADALG